MDEEEKQKLRPPFWCPTCGIPLKNGAGGDDRTLYKWGCCRNCHIEFIEHREERWVGGWRPSKEEVDRMFEKLRG